MDEWIELGFDVDKGIESVGSKSLYRDVVKTFARETGYNLVMVYDAVEEKEYEEAKRIFHTIKGGAAMVCHQGIQTRSKDLEENMKSVLMAGNGDYKSLLNKTEQYVKYCSEIVVNV